MNAALHTYRATVRATALSLLAEVEANGSVVLAGDDAVVFLNKAVRVAESDTHPLPKGPTKLLPSDHALIAICERMGGRVASSGDLGLVLQAGKTAAIRCARGAGYLNRLTQRGDVEKVEGEGWRVTEAGRARAAALRAALLSGEALA